MPLSAAPAPNRSRDLDFNIQHREGNEQSTEEFRNRGDTTLADRRENASSDEIFGSDSQSARGDADRQRGRRRPVVVWSI